MKSLWPDNFQEKVIKTPKKILDEQGDLLLKVTNGIVYGEVEDVTHIWQTSGDMKRDFIFSFNIRSKFMDRYKYRAFTLAHDVEIYPVKIMLDVDIAKEFSLADIKVTINDESEFIDFLEKIFNSNKLGGVISSIISLSK